MIIYLNFIVFPLIYQPFVLVMHNFFIVIQIQYFHTVLYEIKFKLTVDILYRNLMG